MKTYTKYIIAAVLLIPAIIASFMSYSITIDQDTIQEYINAGGIRGGTHMGVPYEITQIDANITDAVSLDLRGSVGEAHNVQFNVRAEGEITFHNSTFYLSNFTLDAIEYEFESEEDEAVVKGGIQAGSNWLKSKIKGVDADSKYKDIVLDAVDRTVSNPDGVINSVVQKMGRIPIFDMRNGPIMVKTLGAFVTDVVVSDGTVTIEYSPRVIWLWAATMLLIVLFIFTFALNLA